MVLSSHVHDVSAEAPCAEFHKPLLMKRARLPRGTCPTGSATEGLFGRSDYGLGHARCSARQVRASARLRRRVAQRPVSALMTSFTLLTSTLWASSPLRSAGSNR